MKETLEGIELGMTVEIKNGIISIRMSDGSTYKRFVKNSEECEQAVADCIKLSICGVEYEVDKTKM